MTMPDKFKITIDVTYSEDDDVDPSSILDSVQDNIEEFLMPYGEEVESFNVCVTNVS